MYSFLDYDPIIGNIEGFMDEMNREVLAKAVRGNESEELSMNHNVSDRGIPHVINMGEFIVRYGGW